MFSVRVAGILARVEQSGPNRSRSAGSLRLHKIDEGTAVSDTDIASARTASRGRTGKRVRQILKDVENPKKRPSRGMPPPPTFDFDALADGTHLNQRETAAVLRRSVSCLENWREDPTHLLKWQYVAGRVTYTVRAIRKFRTGATTTK
jgi:hypothetical protein